MFLCNLSDWKNVKRSGESATDCMKSLLSMHGEERVFSLHRSKVFFVYLCVGLCLESIVHIRHYLLLIQTERNLLAEKLQFMESCSFVYTSTLACQKKLHTANEKSNKRQEDHRNGSMFHWYGDQTWNRLIGAMRFIVTSPLKKLDQRNWRLFRREDKGKLQVPFALKCKSPNNAH